MSGRAWAAKSVRRGLVRFCSSVVGLETGFSAETRIPGRNRNRIWSSHHLGAGHFCSLRLARWVSKAGRNRVYCCVNRHQGSTRTGQKPEIRFSSPGSAWAAKSVRRGLVRFCSSVVGLETGFSGETSTLGSNRNRIWSSHYLGAGHFCSLRLARCISKTGGNRVYWGVNRHQGSTKTG